MKNNQSHKSGENSTLYNISTKGLPLWSHIFVLTSPVFFAVTKFLYTTSIYLSVSTNETGIKSEISGVMWQVAPESKIHLVSCELYPKSILGISELEDIQIIDDYIFCDSIKFSLFSNVLSILFDLYAWFLGFSAFQWTFLSKVSGFRTFAMKWSSDPHLKHVFGFWLLCSLCLLLELRELKVGFLYPFPFSVS